jgi:hypothetical protein
MRATDSDLIFGVDSEYQALDSRPQWPQESLNKHARVVPLPTKIILPDQGFIDTDHVLLADMELMRREEFVSPTSQ